MRSEKKMSSDLTFKIKINIIIQKSPIIFVIDGGKLHCQLRPFGVFGSCHLIGTQNTFMA